MPSASGRRGETWQETRAYWSYRALERAAPSMPPSIGRPVAGALGALACGLASRTRAAVAANQARVLGLAPADERVRTATRDAFRLYVRYWYDTFRLRAMSPEAVNACTDVVGLHHVDAALARGRGCLLVLPHLGNWDVAGRFLAVNGYRAAAVAEKLRPPRLCELFLRHRRELGMRIVLLDEAANVAGELAELLAGNWIVALLADRDLSGRGIPVEMFGATRRVPKGPAVLSRRTGAPVLAVAVYTTRAGWRIEVEPPLEIPPGGDRRTDVRLLSAAMARAFERAIARRPADWHVFAPAWETGAEREG